MLQGGKDSAEGATVARLLVAAAHEFARHGFTAARIRDIVETAGVNLSAVNYHFGGKQGLYEATVAMLLEHAHDDLPAESLQARILPPEERLLALARVMLTRYLGGEHPSTTSRIVAHELLDPTPALESILRRATGPQWERLREIVAELLGPRASEEDVALSSLSIAGQWLFFLFGRRLVDHQFPAIAQNPGRVDRLAEHIAAFSIAAMRERRIELEGGTAHAAPGEPPAGRESQSGAGKGKVAPAKSPSASRRESPE